MLDDPRVNFAISSRSGEAGLDHLGIQVETPDELQEVYGRLKQADRPVLEEGATTCCYAQSEKSWITDPQGLSWETFLTTGESTVYGDSVDLGPIRKVAAAQPLETPQGACCAPKPQPAAEAACCGAEIESEMTRVPLNVPRTSADGEASRVTIYHNPDCGTSRNVLALIRNSGEEPHIIEYLKTPPSRDELGESDRAHGHSVCATCCAAKGRLTMSSVSTIRALTDDQLLDAMMAHPILINRPIVVTPKGVKLCRPSETVLDILEAPQRGAFTKEDGEKVIGPDGNRHSKAHIMSDTAATAGRAVPAKPAMGVFERFLTLWVALCIIAGIALGQMIPGFFHMLGEATVSQVNMPVAVLVWLMVIPMLLKIDLAALAPGGTALARHRIHGRRQLAGETLLHGVARLDLHRASVPALAARRIRSTSYTAGLILLAAAPCTAMVFVWSNLVDGEPHFTLSQVALNDTIMVVAFAPIVALLLGLSSITVPWDTLILSVVLYIVVPVIVAQLWRAALLHRGGAGSACRARWAG